MALFQVSQRLVKYQQPICSINSSHGCFSENRGTTDTTKTSNFNKIFHSFIIIHFGVYIPLFFWKNTHQSTNITPSPAPHLPCLPKVQAAWNDWTHEIGSREARGEAFYTALFDAAPSLQLMFKNPKAVTVPRLEKVGERWTIFDLPVKYGCWTKK